MKTFCLNMIVKDESSVILECLESVKPLIDYWVIVDTGSSDGTQDMIRECMHGIPGELHERIWVNFGYNRNGALELAKKKGDYLLFIDADEKLIYPSTFAWPKLNKDCFIANGLFEKEQIEFGRVLLIDNSLDWEWVGVIHEEIRGCRAAPRTGAFLDSIHILTDLGGSRSNDPERYRKDADLLEKALREDPLNSRSIFYLALSYDVANEQEKAFQNYLKRSEMNGAAEEIYYSFYRIARLGETLGYPPDQIMENYRKSYQMRPYRAEPLYYLAKYMLKNNDFDAAELLLQTAVYLPQPKDVAFVELAIYQYESLWLWLICLIHQNRMGEVKRVLEKLIGIQNLPEDYRAQIKTLLSEG
jgi:glycosyltransferase involved in cell wall biosynthesis